MCDLQGVSWEGHQGILGEKTGKYFETCHKSDKFDTSVHSLVWLSSQSSGVDSDCTALSVLSLLSTGVTVDSATAPFFFTVN